jgi:glycerophosphoryl diester phosphodiesterase
VRNAKKWLVRAGVGGAVVIVMAWLGARAIMGRVCTGAKPPVASKSSELPFFSGLPPVLNIAHRGASKSAPEHSARAYELALRQGAHVLELDLRSTRDQVLVVAHDEDLARTLGIQARLAELSWVELGQVAGERAPLSLDAVLERFPAARFNLELKDESLEAARVLARLIAERGVGDRVLVASAHAAVLTEFRNARSGLVATSASTREVLGFHFCYLLGQTCRTPFAALQLPALGWLGLTEAEFMRHAHDHGVVVHFWTIDDEPRMRALIAAGADGIMTNHPELLAHVLAGSAG